MKKEFIITLGICLLSLPGFDALCQDRPGSAADTANLFREPYRPQYHLTAKAGALFDPTDLIYYKGAYHVNNGMAVSTDLVHWRLGKRARLSTDKEAQMSGSAVYDKNNTSGFGKNGKGPLVAIYSGLQRSNRTQYQCIAYSNDDGKSWQIYEGNPVIDFNSTEFRDPQVFWHEETQKWVMAVALAAQKKISFYGSKDLKNWKHLSDFGPMGAVNGVWECPDIFPLYVDGKKENKTWVLALSVQPLGGQYFVGSFDGNDFMPDTGFVNQLDLLKQQQPTHKGHLLFDFEDDFKGWTVEGDAFSDKPETGPVDLQGPVIGYQGVKFVNSFHNGDKGAGKLTSPEFTIDKPFLNFLLGGGAYPEDVHMDLLVDGKVVRTMSGVNTEVLYWKSWDVAEFNGRRATITITDKGDGDFRHISVDQIMLADQPATDAWEKAFWIDYGPDFYAVRSWVNGPENDDRRIWVAWLGSWLYAREVPTTPWKGGHSFPRTVELKTLPEGIQLVQQPVKEIESLRSGHFQIKNKMVKGRLVIPQLTKFENTYEIITEIEAGDAEEAGFDIAAGKNEKTTITYNFKTATVSVDRKQSGEVNFSPAFPRVYSAPASKTGRTVKLHFLVDKSVLEVFVNQGEAAITSQMFPADKSYGVRFFSTGGKARIISLDGWKINSIWKK